MLDINEKDLLFYYFLNLTRYFLLLSNFYQTLYYKKKKPTYNKTVSLSQALTAPIFILYSLAFSIAALTETGTSLAPPPPTPSPLAVTVLSRETSTGFCSIFETGFDCSDFFYDSKKPVRVLEWFLVKWVLKIQHWIGLERMRA